MAMDAPLTFSLFLGSLVTCSVMSVIGYKYQQTISPGSQNIINKLNFFLVELEMKIQRRFAKISQSRRRLLLVLGPSPG